MQLIFERGDRDHPVGHALIYFRADDGALLATYAAVLPIQMDLSKFLPGFLQNAMEGMDLAGAGGVVAIPPIPEEVPGEEWLRALAAQRQDDLIFAGGTMREPMRLAAEAAEAGRLYAELYGAVPIPETVPAEPVDAGVSRFAELSEADQLKELTGLVGRLRDSLGRGSADPDLLRELELLADVLPAKYRAHSLVAAAGIPGERGQRLAQLHLERCYKLFHEEYLELERIDREIEAISG